MPKLALILGSVRTPSNARGIAAWLSSALESRLNALTPEGQPPVEITVVDPLVAPLPLGPLLDGNYIPAGIRSSDAYPTAPVQQWSCFVSSCDAFVVLSPQYNWGYPGELKNAFDHLYFEWRDKPVAVATYGGHGGNKCNEQLRALLSGAFNMKVIEKPLEIHLPKEYARGEAFVPSTGPFPDFLSKEEALVSEIASELAQALSPKL